MKKIVQALALLLITLSPVAAREYHVSVKGNDSNRGTESAPLKTISAAAAVAIPGDVITVHEGTYREWVNPARGGTCDKQRIVYRAAQGEKVFLKGSEEIKGWEKVEGYVWKVTLPNSFFGSYNPYKDLITGDWFNNHGRDHHTGEVFLNGKSFYEKESLDKVKNPVAMKGIADTIGSTYTWYCQSDDANTTIWANFHGANPNKELVEISTRPTCFYPSEPGINYLTLSGFNISQAATQWGAPTAEQIGMVATHWNKGWIIENNTISDSKCSGITLGKERATGHNVWSENPSRDGSLHYIEVTFNTLRNGWNKENIGSHIVRNNTIFNCEQTGMCGSMGAAFSTVENNHIYNIWTKRQFSGAEIGGIKFHAAIDTEIRGNRIHNSGRGIWLDWMTQGTHVTGNLLYNNDQDDLFVEVSHGPFMVDNNILASPTSMLLVSEGGTMVHNLILGRIHRMPDLGRYTPYHLAHSTEVKGLSITLGGDDRYYNNIFATNWGTEQENQSNDVYGMQVYDKANQPSFAAGNVYYNGAKEYKNETDFTTNASLVPQCTIEEKGSEVFLNIVLDDKRPKTEVVTTDRLGKTTLVELPFEQADGTPYVIDTDYFGAKRSAAPSPGPFETPGSGAVRLKVW